MSIFKKEKHWNQFSADADQIFNYPQLGLPNLK